MIAIGLTGGILTGKSTVSQMLSELGAVIIDADKIGHEVYQPHTEAWQEVVAAFGTEILEPNGDINRARLGHIVFNNPQALKQLNKIMHPRIHHRIKERLEGFQKQVVDVVVVEAAVLLEANWTDLVDEVWVTVAPEATVIGRLRNRLGLTEEQARARIRSQLSSAERAKQADVVIDTDCELAAVKARVEELWHKVYIKEKVKRILGQRQKKTIPKEHLTPAAVVLLLYPKEGQYHVLFTQRTEKVEYHKRQISFPGGARDEQDENIVATALRETFEEIGVKAEDIEILGELDEMATFTSNFAISPFVAAIPYPYQFKLNADETDQLIEVPLSALLDRNSFIEEPLVYEGRSIPGYHYRYKGHVIWGATATILNQFLDLVFKTPSQPR